MLENLRDIFDDPKKLSLTEHRCFYTCGSSFNRGLQRTETQYPEGDETSEIHFQKSESEEGTQLCKRKEAICVEVSTSEHKDFYLVTRHLHKGAVSNSWLLDR